MNFLQGLISGYNTLGPSDAELERKRQSESYTRLFDLIKQNEQAAQGVQASNSLYNAVKDFNALNPNKNYSFGPIPANSTSFDNLSLNNPINPSPANGGLTSLLPQKSVSLIPTEIKQTPKYDNSEMYNFLSKAIGSGVDASIAMPVVSNYYKSKKADIDQSTLDNDFGALSKELSASNFSDPGAKRKAILRLAQYNQKAQSLGKSGLDMASMMNAINSDDVTYDEVKVAGPDGTTQLQGVMRPKNGGYMLDGNGKQVPYILVGDPRRTGISEDTMYNNEQANYRHVTPSGSTVYASDHRVGSGGGAGGMSAGDSRQFNAARQVIALHEQWMKDRKDLTGQMPDPSQSPYFKDAQSAQKVVQGFIRSEAGLPEQSNFKVNYTGDPEIDSYIDKAREQGMSEDWINEKVYQSLEAKKQKEVTRDPAYTGTDYLGF